MKTFGKVLVNLWAVFSVLFLLWILVSWFLVTVNNVSGGGGVSWNFFNVLFYVTEGIK